MQKCEILEVDLYPRKKPLSPDGRRMFIQGNPGSRNTSFLNKVMIYRGARLVKDEKDNVRILLGLICEEPLPTEPKKRMSLAVPSKGGTRVRTAMVEDYDRKGDTELLLSGPIVECAAGYANDRRVWLSLSTA